MPQERTKTEKELDPKKDISFEEAFKIIADPKKEPELKTEEESEEEHTPNEG